MQTSTSGHYTHLETFKLHYLGTVFSIYFTLKDSNQHIAVILRNQRILILPKYLPGCSCHSLLTLLLAIYPCTITPTKLVLSSLERLDGRQGRMRMKNLEIQAESLCDSSVNCLE